MFIVTWNVNALHYNVFTGSMTFKERHRAFASALEAKHFIEELMQEEEVMNIKVFKAEEISVNHTEKVSSE